jgi:hypothetical protein
MAQHVLHVPYSIDAQKRLVYTDWTMTKKIGSMLSGGGDKTSPLFLCPFSFKTEKHQ